MKALKLALSILAVAMLGLSVPAVAQTGIPPTYVCPTCTTSLATNTSSARVALPSTAPVYNNIVVYNTGAVDAFVRQGDVTITATADANSIRVPAGGIIQFGVTGNLTTTYLAGITGSSSATLRVYQTAGALDISVAGTGGGGGGGGAVTIADGADVTQGTTGDTHTAGTVVGFMKDVYTALTTGPVPVSASSLPLPTGASTAANQATGNTSLGTIATNTTGASLAANQTAVQANAGSDATKAVSIQGITSGKAVPISAASLPLPTGAATSANQSAGTAGSASSVVGTIQGIASMTPVQVSQATASNLNANITNISGTVSLPTGAATAAKQPALGTAGSPSTDVLTVQGSSSGTAIPVTSGVAQASTTSGQTLSPVGMATLTSAPTYTTAQTNIPWLRTNGAQAQDLASINGTTVSTGTGAQGTGTARVTVATDSATVAGSSSLPAGSNVIGHVIADTGSTTAATQATGTNLHTVTDSTSVSQAVPGTSGGLTFATVTAANSTNATNLKGSAGQLYHVTAYNNSATLAWVSFYNTSGTPTCGTSIVYQVMIPANSTSGAGAIDDIPAGLAFSTGIGYCITTGIAGTGNVAASAYVANFGYK